MGEGGTSHGGGKKRLREEQARGEQVTRKRRRRGEGDTGVDQTDQDEYMAEKQGNTEELPVGSLREAALQLLAHRPRMASLGFAKGMENGEEREGEEWKRALREFTEVTRSDRERSGAHWLATAVLQKWGKESTEETLQWLHTTAEHMTATADVILDGEEFVRLLCGRRGGGPLSSCRFVVAVTYDCHVTTMGTLFGLLRKSGREDTLVNAIATDVKGGESDKRAAGVVLEAIARDCALGSGHGRKERRKGRALGSG